MKYLAKNPARGGIPANDKRAKVITNAKNGLRLFIPLKLSIASSFVLKIEYKTVNEAILATEYADA